MPTIVDIKKFVIPELLYTNNTKIPMIEEDKMVLKRSLILRYNFKPANFVDIVIVSVACIKYVHSNDNAAP